VIQGFYGEAWVSLKMTNNLTAGPFTAVFETFSVVTGTLLNDETHFQQVNGDCNYYVITFTHDYRTTHSKAIIQFSSYGQQGEITFQIRYYGSSYNQALKF